jgi:hypothetical protein
VQRFNEILRENGSNGARALVSLFTDNELQNLRGRYAGTTSATRLEWVLGVTFGSGNIVENGLARLSQLSPSPYYSVNLQFGVLFPSDCDANSGVASDLEDSGTYVNSWGGKAIAVLTNQINHFLSGVGEYYYEKDLRTIIAHEKSTDATLVPGFVDKVKTTKQNYTNEVTPADYSHFYRAWHFDTNGMYAERDQELWPILEFDPDIAFGNIDPNRVGNSLQDLRLSLRAVRFASWVMSNRSSNPNQAGDWLANNLLPLIASGRNRE